LNGWLLLLPSLLPLLAAPLLASPPAGSGEFNISTDVELVLLDVSVKDATGGYVSHLTKDDFRVSEMGVPQKITVFSHSDVPITAGLVMDASGSMLAKQADVITAGLVFAGAGNPQDQIFVVNFNDTVRPGLPEGVPFSDDIGVLRLALARDKPQGRTALNDALAWALKHLESGQREKKALVLVSDGGDNSSNLKSDEMMRLIEESHATIYTVGLFDADDPDRNPRILKRIAQVSGGECFLAETYDQVIPVCRRIAEDIRSRYTIGYVPNRSGHGAAIRNISGAVRNIKVTASAEGHEHLVVRSRGSYVLPETKKPTE
jgi:Ca-activated chloride channel family protein